MKEKLAHLPTSAGCYLMLNSHGTVIYVGKAKNLKNRVKSYFTGAHNAKTELLISEITDFNYIVTNSEQESLILEYNLIKQYSPRYNIRLMDDKTYPYIEITQEKHPRLIVARYKEVPKGATLFGPYPNGWAAKETVRLLQKLYPLRRCTTIGKGACIYYHINQCLGACINDQIDYQPNIMAITNFLKGDTKTILNQLKTQMELASSSLEFERAVEYRDMINYVNQTTEKQIISLNDYVDRDFISFHYNENDLSIHILNMRQGRIMDSHQTVFGYIQDVKEAFLTYLLFYYEKVLLPDELVFDHQVTQAEVEGLFNKRISFPKRGDKKKLIDLCHKNAVNDLEHYHKINQANFEKSQIAYQELEKIVDKSVRYIEVFDNAQLFGVAPISGMIVYKNGQFEKKMYRKFHTKSANQDDYQALREVIYRRYQRQLMEGQQLPDLICVDGGKGQVSSTINILNELELRIPVIGLKKDRTHQLESLIYQQEIIPLAKASPLYHLMVSLSEEVHRFTISFHRQTRNRKNYQSVLDKIPGLGEKRKKQLLLKYDSIESIREASNESFKELGFSEKLIKAIKEGVK